MSDRIQGLGLFSLGFRVPLGLNLNPILKDPKQSSTWILLKQMFTTCSVGYSAAFAIGCRKRYRLEIRPCLADSRPAGSLYLNP